MPASSTGGNNTSESIDWFQGFPTHIHIKTWQVYQFLETEKGHQVYLTEEEHLLVKYVVNHSQRPKGLDNSHRPVSARTRSRGSVQSDVDSSVSRVPPFPWLWSEDEATFRKEFDKILPSLQRRFGKAIREPQSVSMADPRSSRDNQDEQSDASRLKKEKSDAIDLEYDEPAGPSTTAGRKSYGKGKKPSTSATLPTIPVESQQMSDLSKIISINMAEAIAHFLREQNRSSPSTPGSSLNSTRDNRWKPEELGFFDPQLPQSFGKGEIVYQGKDLYYRSVILFIERIRDLADVKGAELIRTNLNTCLRGAALGWYNAELTDLERKALRRDPDGVNDWCAALKKRFKESTSVALKNLLDTKYTVKDAKDGAEPSIYVQTLIRHAKAANLESTENQLSYVYNNLDPELRLNIDPPTPTTTVAQIIEALDRKKEVWFDYYNRPRPSYGNYQTYNNRGGRGQSQFRSGRNNDRSYDRPFRMEKVFVEKGTWNGNSKFTKDNKDRADSSWNRNNNSGRQPFSKTSGNDRPQSTETSKPSWNGKGKERELQVDERGRRTRFGDKPNRSRMYMLTEAESDEYREEEDYDNDQEYREDAGNQDEESADDADDEVDAHFVPTAYLPEYRCRRCTNCFTSNNKLHRHLRENACQQTEIEAFKLEPTTEKPSNRRVIMSTAIKCDGAGLSFRKWRYATAKGRLSLQEDSKLADFCLDTGCAVTLVNRNFLKSTRPDLKIKRLEQPLWVNGIGSDRHNSQDYMVSEFSFPGTKDGEEVTAGFRREMHIVDGLKANVLVGLDATGPEGFVLDLHKCTAVIRQCESVVIPISISSCSGPRVSKPVRVQSNTVVPAESTVTIPVHHLDLPVGRDFIFEPDAIPLTLYAHWVDSNLSHVLATNHSHIPHEIPKNRKLGMICEMDYEGCFHVSSEKYNLAARSKPPRWLGKPKNSIPVTIPVASTAEEASAAVSDGNSEMKSGEAQTETTTTTKVMAKDGGHDSDISTPEEEKGRTRRQEVLNSDHRVKDVQAPRECGATTNRQDEYIRGYQQLWQDTPIGTQTTTSRQADTIFGYLDGTAETPKDVGGTTVDQVDTTPTYPGITNLATVNAGMTTHHPVPTIKHYHPYIPTLIPNLGATLTSQVPLSNLHQPGIGIATMTWSMPIISPFSLLSTCESNTYNQLTTMSPSTISPIQVPNLQQSGKCHNVATQISTPISPKQITARHKPKPSTPAQRQTRRKISPAVISRSHKSKDLVVDSFHVSETLSENTLSTRYKLVGPTKFAKPPKVVITSMKTGKPSIPAEKFDSTKVSGNSTKVSGNEQTETLVTSTPKSNDTKSTMSKDEQTATAAETTILEQEGRSERKHAMGVTVFADDYEYKRVSALIRKYQSLWDDNGGFVDVPEEQWMRIPLKTNWADESKGKAKVYPLSPRDRELVDAEFDKLHCQGRLFWTKTHTPFSYPVFVVWRTIGTERKGRVVVDIRALNKLVQRDAYPVPMQQEILALVKDSKFISTIDCTSFFHQWRVATEDRHKLTVVSHRGQETFAVAVMGFANSPAYVQRMMDQVLRKCRRVSRAYMDDIVIYSRTFNEHLQDLEQILRTLKEYNIAIKSSKSFLCYPSVILLGQRVDSLGLSTAKEKLSALSKLSFPKTLKELEMYLELTGYLRNYVPFYAQLASPLQKRKTDLLKPAPKKGNPRKSFSAKTKLDEPTVEERASFEALQEALSEPQTLTHFDANKPLYLDMDASKAFGFGARIFHSTDGKKAEPIAYLSRLLTSAETRYWPTELEVAGLVWVVRKIRHMIEASESPTTVWTDHSATIGIGKSTSLSTTSTDRLNLRLIRASEYLQRFNLKLVHIPGKSNVVPDALSRLASTNASLIRPNPESAELDEIENYKYEAFMVEMEPDFRRRIVEGYKTDPHYSEIMEMVDKNDELDANAAKLPFLLKDGLLLRVDRTSGLERVCVPDAVTKQIFEVAHSEQHQGFTATFEKVAASWYIHRLNKKLNDFLKHCPECLIMQTKRHAPYGALQPIQSPPTPFHTLTMDFILGLPKTKEGENCLMSVTDKFTKRVTLIPGKDTWTETEWARHLLERLQLADWGLPKVLITDRDRKFTSDLWNEIFRTLKVDLFYSTAYHPQTDGQSERTNQTVEIALRYYLNTLEDFKTWPEVLPRLAHTLNNTRSRTTGKTPNEIAYGFILPSAADFLQVKLGPDYVTARIEASDAIAMAQMSNKHFYDKKHKLIFFEKGDWVYVNLHKGYDIPLTQIIGKKLSPQRQGPFQITKRVGKLAYEVAIPDNWRVFPVFSIAQLEPSPAPGSDPYNRTPPEPGPVYMAGDEEGTVKSFEVERIVGKKRRYNKTHYLIRWKGYTAAHDVWRSEQEMEDAKELIEEFESRELTETKDKAAGVTKATTSKRGRGRPKRRQE